MMASRTDRPLAPRVSPPDLPDQLDEVSGLGSRPEEFRTRIVALDNDTDASHLTLTECVLAGAAADRLDLTGSVLVDVEIDDLRATAVTARGARWRRVRVTGGRIGTLDLAEADLDEVELRGVRIDYLSLGGARAIDVVIADATITTLDIPQATLERVSFRETRADEVDNRGLHAAHVDLRGLDAVAFLDPTALRGATLTPWQLERLAPALGAALGIDVRD